MNVDVRPLLNGETSRVGFDFSFIPETGASEADEGIRFPNGARVVGCVTGCAGLIELTAEISLDYTAPCARCLAEVGGLLKLELTRTVDADGTISNDENDCDYAEAPGGMLDVEELAREQIILEFPMRILCAEDCPGLCPRCGKSLASCGCGCPKEEIDPRLAALKKLLDE